MTMEPSGLTESPASLPSRSMLLTFLIADVRGYTRFTVDHGDEAAARLAGTFARIAKEVAAAHGGEVIELRGDEALAVFASARNALRAAVALQKRFAQQMAADPALPLNVGIGLDAGEALAIEGGYRGGALNLAARLCSIAGGGEVFSSETVIGLARKTDGIAFVDRGEVSLKGLDKPVRVIQIAPAGELREPLPPLQPILVTHPNNLPPEPTPFIGREGEIAQIADLLRDRRIRMVTLTGPGGTGKTRLALQVGNTLLKGFRDGVYFVNLAPLTEPSLVASSIADVLGVKEEAGTDIVERLGDALQGKQILLVLDNFEHLLPAAPVIARLLDCCSELHVLVTSRIPLHLSWEHEHAVPPLSIPDPLHLPDLESLSQYEAVALFIDRARASKDSFTVTNENAPAVAEICARLDGLPLAIELAAARIKLFPPQALLQRLTRRLTLLTGGAKDRPTRQQTLRGAVDWSYSLLSEEEKTLFARLSVFVSGCTFEASEEVCNEEGDLDLLEGVASLVDKSLLQQHGDEQPRFVMLETIREYASEKLRERGEEQTVRDQHLLVCLDLARNADEAMHGPAEREWCERLETELDNLRAALHWAEERGRIEDEMRLACSLVWFWYARGYWTEGRERLAAVLARPAAALGDEEHVARAWALLGAGMLTGMQGDLDVAEPWLREAAALGAELGREGARIQAHAFAYLALFHDSDPAAEVVGFAEESLRLAQDSGDRWASAFAHLVMGSISACRSQHGSARRHHEAALAIFRELGDTLHIAAELGNLGIVSVMQGDLRTARAQMEEANRMARSIGMQRDLAVGLQNLGRVLLHQGEIDKAIGLEEESLALARAIGSKELIVGASVNRAYADVLRQDYESASVRYEESLALARTIGRPAEVAEILGDLALVSVRRGDLERARMQSEEGLALARAAGLDSVTPYLLEVRGRIHQNEGDDEQARALFQEALRAAGNSPNAITLLTLLRDVAVLAARTGGAERAARLLAAEAALRREMGLGLDKVSAADLEQAAAQTRAVLGEAGWARAEDAGRAMGLDEAVVDALPELEP